MTTTELWERLAESEKMNDVRREAGLLQLEIICDLKKQLAVAKAEVERLTKVKDSACENATEATDTFLVLMKDRDRATAEVERLNLELERLRLELEQRDVDGDR